MPRVSGSYEADPSRGLSQINRSHRRRNRAISRATSSGSPRSQPSETINTMGSLRMTRRAQCTLNARSDSPMRVPPPQSCTVLTSADMPR